MLLPSRPLKQKSLLCVEPSTTPTIEAIREKGFKDFEFFAAHFFPHHCPIEFSSMHQELFQLEANPYKRGRREVIAAPRGNAKTTIMLLIKALHAIVYGYEKFILVIGYSSEDAQAKVKDILDELQNNDKLKSVFGELLSSTRQHGTKRFLTTNNILVLARSRGQSVRGLKHGPYRPSLIILDDIESLARVYNPDQRVKTSDWFFKDVMKLGQLHSDTKICVIGTCLHHESLLSALLVSPGWHSKCYRSILHEATNTSLWEKYKELLTNLSDPHRLTTSQNYFETNKEAMLEGSQVLWPEGEPYDQLVRQRILEGEASFNSEKQNAPYDPTRQLFDMRLAKRFRFVTGQHEPEFHWLDGSQKIVRRRYLQKVVMYVDPAFTEKSAQSRDPDYSAIVVGAMDDEGYMYVLDAKVERLNPSAQVDAIFALQDKYGLTEVHVETNGSQILMKKVIKDAVEHDKGHRELRVIGRHQTEDKYKRISTLQPDIANGHLLFEQDLDQRFIEQLTYFPTTHDDGPDALHGMVRELKQRPGTISNYRSPVTT